MIRLPRVFFLGIFSKLVFCKGKKCKALPPNFWIKGISSCLAGTGSSVCKTDPCQQARTPKEQRLYQECNKNCKKEGAVGSIAKFMVAISHGTVVIESFQFEEHKWRILSAVCLGQRSSYFEKWE